MCRVGFVSLQRAGLTVDTYCSSEVDPAALLVGQKHFGDKITQLGDVTKITNEQVCHDSSIVMLHC